LKDNEPDQFPFELSLITALQQVKQRLLHQLKHHKDLLVVLESAQDLYDVRVALEQFQN